MLELVQSETEILASETRFLVTGAGYLVTGAGYFNYSDQIVWLQGWHIHQVMEWLREGLTGEEENRISVARRCHNTTDLGIKHHHYVVRLGDFGRLQLVVYVTSE